MRKRLVLSGIIALLLVALMAVGIVGSGAWFWDTETVTGNTFTAGTLDLVVDGVSEIEIDPWVTGNEAPGHVWGAGQMSWHTWVLANVGSLPGNVSMTIRNLTNLENVITEPEAQAGDTSDVGELGGLLQTIWESPPEPPVEENEPWLLYGYGALGQEFRFLNAANGVAVSGPRIGPGTVWGMSVPLTLRLHWNQSTGDNQAQGDSVRFDVEFRLDQVRP